MALFPSRRLQLSGARCQRIGAAADEKTYETRGQSKSIAREFSRGQGYLPARGRRAPLTAAAARNQRRTPGCTRGHAFG